MTNIRLNLNRNLIATLLAFLFLSACSSQPASTPFRPPVEETRPAAAIETIAAQPVTPQIFATPTFIILALATPTPCINNLTYIQDVTIPDDTVVTPGSQIDKQWLVQNSGACNWGSSYHLKLISGDALGAPIDQALYPARAGSQATIRILFTAPSNAGTYESSWQAYDADGNAFGVPIYIRIIVQ